MLDNQAGAHYNSAIFQKGERLMRSHVTRAIALGLCLTAISTACSAKEEIRWSKSFDAAMTEAKSANKLIMADFYTDW